MKRCAAEKGAASEQLLSDKTNEPVGGPVGKTRSGNASKHLEPKTGFGKLIRDLQALATDVRQRYLTDVVCCEAE